MSGEPSSFLSRWARRKADVRRGVEVDAAAPAPDGAPTAHAPTASGAATATPEAVGPANAQVGPRVAPPAAPATPAQDAALPLPTLDDVARLTRESDYAPFVRPGVDTEVKNAALKKLFSDPHFNVMDGLDTYIDDYGKPDPISPAMLRQLNQATSLGLFDVSPADAKDARGAHASDAEVPVAASSQAPGGDAEDACSLADASSVNGPTAPQAIAGDSLVTAGDPAAQPSSPAIEPSNIRPA